MDIDLTTASTWSQQYFEEVMLYLKNSGMDDMARQAQEWRDGGESKLEEWQRVEAVANTMSSEELAKTGKGVHLLENQTISPDVASEPVQEDDDD